MSQQRNVQGRTAHLICVNKIGCLSDWAPFYHESEPKGDLFEFCNNKQHHHSIPPPARPQPLYRGRHFHVE